jgi:diguanylate cyclase (GGDEF)-like protein
VSSATADDRRPIAHTAAVIYAGAVAVGLVEAFIPGGSTTFSNGPGIAALVLAPLAFFAGPRLPRAALAVLGPVGAALVGWALATTHGYGDGAVLYMWPVLWTAYFYGRRGAIAIVAWIGLVHGVSLLAMPAGQGNADRWVDVVVSVIVVAAVTCYLSERNQRLVNELVAEARVDPLTGLLNRRGLQERMAVEVARMLRDGSGMAAVMFDIDHFKRVNDLHGHEVGDRVLAWIGSLLRHEVRGADMAARSGGEEFVVVLPGADVEEAHAFAERVRATVERCTGNDGRRDHGLPEGVALTISAGVAASDRETGEALVESADRALYAAKRGGRNRTVVAAEPAPVSST